MRHFLPTLFPESRSGWRLQCENTFRRSHEDLAFTFKLASLLKVHLAWRTSVSVLKSISTSRLVSKAPFTWLKELCGFLLQALDRHVVLFFMRSFRLGVTVWFFIGIAVWFFRRSFRLVGTWHCIGSSQKVAGVTVVGSADLLLKHTTMKCFATPGIRLMVVHNVHLLSLRFVIRESF